MSDWNQEVIEEFRANEGRVGGDFEGAPMVLVHHRGRRTGQERVAPMMYLPGDDDDTIYAFAAKAGAADTSRLVPQPHRRRQHHQRTGRKTYAVTVREVTGEDRDRIYDEQAARYPGFAEYAAKTAGSARSPSWP